MPCAVCTGAGYERSTEPAEHLPILGRRYSYNDERNSTGTALAGDKLGTDHGLYAEGSGRIAPGGQYRRRMGSCADGSAGGKTQPCTNATGRQWRACCMCNRPRYYTRNQSGFTVPLERVERWKFQYDKHICDWFWPTYAHRKQVHGLLYVAAHRLTPKGVAA